MADVTIQETVFSANRAFGAGVDDTGTGLLSILARARQNKSTLTTGVTDSLRDQYTQGTKAPGFGADSVVTEIGTYSAGQQQLERLRTAAGLYANAGPRVVRQGLLFSGNTKTTPFSALADNLTSAIRSGVASSGENRNVTSVQQAARLYRLTNQGINGQAGLLPASTIFDNQDTGTFSASTYSTPVETAVSLTATFSGTSENTLSDTANLYLATGYRQFQTPQLLRNLFA